MDSKSWYASKTIWGVVIALIATLASMFHHPLDSQDQADLTGIAEILGQLIGLIVAFYGRMVAQHTLRTPKPSAASPGGGAATSLLLALGLGMLMAAGGCQATDTPTTIYGKSLSISSALHESAHSYHVIASATTQPATARESRYAVEKQLDLVLQGVEAVVDSLKSDSQAYQAAKAAGNDAEAEAVTSRARITFDALNALATRMAAITAKTQ